MLAVRPLSPTSRRNESHFSLEMRDQVGALVRGIQRSKTRKSGRITSNMVMRVAVQHLLKRYRLDGGGDIPNGEAQLL